MGWYQRIANLFRQGKIDSEIDRELSFHLEERVDELVTAGLDEDEARRTAVRQFGNFKLERDTTRDMDMAVWLESIAKDFGYAARGLLRNKALTLTVVLTLALAIGANTAMFSVVHNVLTRPLPYPDADRLVRIYTVQVEGGARDGSTIPDYFDWKQRATSFETIEGFLTDTVVMDGERKARVPVVRPTPGFLNLIGARAAQGRLIDDDDMRVDAPPVVVLAHDFWTSRFGANPGVVGQTIRLGEPRYISSGGFLREEIDFAIYTVVEVATPIEGPLLGTVQAMVPWVIDTDPRRESRSNWFLPIVARLRPGVTVTGAQAELDRIRSDLREEQPGAGTSIPVVVSLHDATVAAVRPALIALLGATGLILLIAVSNITNILLAHASFRQPELSMRSALGASPVRLARFLLTESVLLSLLGGVGGAVLGYVGIRALVFLEPAWIPRLHEITLNNTVLAATFGVAVGSALLFGLAPLLFLRDARMLGGGVIGGRPAGGRGWLRSGLIVSQIALTFVLLVGSGLMIRSFLALRDVPIGIDSEQIVTFSLGSRGFLISSSGPARVTGLQQYREALEHVRAIPGVRGLTLTSQAPLTGASGSVSVELVSGSRSGEMYSPVGLVGVTANFFDFFRSPAIAGRLFEPEDSARADSVVVVDAIMAALIWPEDPAVGQRLRFFGGESEVIGVVEPIRYTDLEQEMRPKLFHLLDRSGGGMFGNTVLVRHDGESAPILAAIEARLNEEVDEALSPRDLRPLGALYDRYLREPRFYLLLLGGLGFMGLAVAGAGVYGVVAYSVEQRTGEIGIRMALGAGRLGIVRLFCRRTMFLVGLGLGAGLIGAGWLTHYLESLLFEIGPADPAAWVSMATLLAATVVAATLIPMHRALRIDPSETLRSD